MKKLTKLIVAALVAFVVSSAAFADDFDWSQCWCTYGGGLEAGDKIINIGAGINLGIVPSAPNSKHWFIPAVEASFEVPVMIWKLPFSFGGSVYYNAHGYKYHEEILDYDYIYSNHSVAGAGLIKYHVHLPPEKLDVYAGVKLGVGFSFESYPDYDVQKQETKQVHKTYPWFYNAEFIGASWYFSDAFGVNVEFGWPIVAKAGVSIKF